MKLERITKILALIIGAILILMAVGQFANMFEFSQSLATYDILPQYARLWSVVFMVAEFLAGVGLIAGSRSPYLFASSAGLAFVVFAGWFLFGLVALNNSVLVANAGFFGAYVAQPVSVYTEAGLALLALITLSLAIQGRFLTSRGQLY